jgi:hypothetical protein
LPFGGNLSFDFSHHPPFFPRHVMFVFLLICYGIFCLCSLIWYCLIDGEWRKGEFSSFLFFFLSGCYVGMYRPYAVTNTVRLLLECTYQYQYQFTALLVSDCTMCAGAQSGKENRITATQSTNEMR